MQRLKRLLIVLALIGIVAINVYLSTSRALFFQQHEIENLHNGAKGYVSDEVWYVDAARNILEKVFHLRPKLPQPEATIVYSNFSQVTVAVDYAPEFNVTVVLYNCSTSLCYKNIPAIYVKAPSYKDIEEFARATNATDIVYGWPLGDASGINTYLNLEHPPLMKYILCLVMLFLGDKPIYWRIPSIIMGAILVVLTYVLARSLGARVFLALIAAGLVAIDPLVFTMASIAMLDIYVATFTAVAVLLAVRRRFHWSVLATAVASAFKFNGLFAAIPLCAFAFSDTLRKTGSAKEAVLTVVYYVCLTFVAFIAIQVLVSIPLIMYLGFSNWVSQSITGAIRWHLSIKCVGPSCPPTSTPWDWFFGINAFVLYVYDHSSIVAEGFVGLYAVAFILAIVSITSFALTKPLSRGAWYTFMGVWLGYVIIWFLGAKTQYSFYAVQIVPYIYVFVVMRLWELLDRNEVVTMFVGWKTVFETIWRAFLSIFR